MQRSALLLLAAMLALSGCKKMEAVTEGHSHGSGRYAGIGLYSPNRLWEKLTIKEEPGNTSAANLADDDMIVVTVDTKTGEIRQCGNLSGRCLASNPWKGTGLPLPANVSIHAAELSAQEEAKQHTTAKLTISN